MDRPKSGQLGGKLDPIHIQALRQQHDRPQDRQKAPEIKPGPAIPDRLWIEKIRLLPLRRGRVGPRFAIYTIIARRRIIGHGYRGFSVPRSEEHTSELQSLMRISYAVFCLK